MGVSTCTCSIFVVMAGFFVGFSPSHSSVDFLFLGTLLSGVCTDLLLCCCLARVLLADLTSFLVLD